jgi:PAS domain S-box-containing protein
MMRRPILLLALWAGMGGAISMLDFFTGPYFQFSYLFVIPVGLASWYTGRTFAVVLAVVLPSLQCLYFLSPWKSALGAASIVVNLAMQYSALIAIAELVHRISRHRQFRIQVLESLPVGMWVVDKKGRLVHTNPEGMAIWSGNPKPGPEERAGPKVWKHGSDTQIVPDERPVLRVLAHGVSLKNAVLDIETHDGSKRVISSSAAPLLDQKGRVQGAVVVNQDITEAKRLEKEREDLIRSLEEARRNIKILSGLLPICASCKRIRDDHGAWEQMEEYIHSHSEAEFSHGICPDCMQRLYPNYTSAINPEA